MNQDTNTIFVSKLPLLDFAYSACNERADHAAFYQELRKRFNDLELKAAQAGARAGDGKTLDEQQIEKAWRLGFRHACDAERLNSDEEWGYKGANVIETVSALAAAPAATTGWRGLTEQERAAFVNEICEYGTGFVAPLFSLAESLEDVLKARNSAAAHAVSAPAWQPIETAPVDVLVWVNATKRMSGPCIAMHHSRDGWVVETPSEWVSIYTPTHWITYTPPAGPEVQAPATVSGSEP